MSKKLSYKLLGALVVVAVAVLWLLSIVVPNAFGFFNLAWAGVILSGGWGAIIIVQGCLEKNIGTIKKFKIWIGCCLLVVAFLALVFAITLPQNIVLPIIAIIFAVGLVTSLLVVGGKKWDEGDNHNVGYKNYHQHKAEQKKQQAKEQDSSDNK